MRMKTSSRLLNDDDMDRCYYGSFATVAIQPRATVSTPDDDDDEKEEDEEKRMEVEDKRQTNATASSIVLDSWLGSHNITHRNGTGGGGGMQTTNIHLSKESGSRSY